MSYFVNIAKANAEIQRLNALLAQREEAANQNASTLTAQIAALENKIKTIDTDFAQVSSDLKTAKASIASLTTENTELKAKLADPKGEIATQVTNALAAQGVDPVAASSVDSSVQTLNRAGFNKLNARQQSEFFKNGGKLID